MLYACDHKKSTLLYDVRHPIVVPIAPTTNLWPFMTNGFEIELI
jgi:hypothetical protein